MELFLKYPIDVQKELLIRLIGVARNTGIGKQYDYKTIYDYETFGVDPKSDRVSQFAGIRTDENFNIIDEPVNIYCKPANDFLPNPYACLITQITPQIAKEKGINENEFFINGHQNGGMQDLKIRVSNTGLILKDGSINFKAEIIKH